MKLLKINPDDQDNDDESDNAMDVDPDGDSDDDDDRITKIKPLSVAEHRGFCKRAKGRILVTPQDFRFDFTLPLTDPFNKHAMYVAAKGFKKAIIAGSYAGMLNLEGDEKVSEHFLSSNHLEYCMKTHFRHLTRRYKEAVTSAGQKARIARQTRAARNSRRAYVSIHIKRTVLRLILAA